MRSILAVLGVLAWLLCSSGKAHAETIQYAFEMDGGAWAGTFTYNTDGTYLGTPVYEFRNGYVPAWIRTWDSTHSQMWWEAFFGTSFVTIDVQDALAGQDRILFAGHAWTFSTAGLYYGTLLDTAFFSIEFVGPADLLSSTTTPSVLPALDAWDTVTITALLKSTKDGGRVIQESGVVTSLTRIGVVPTPVPEPATAWLIGSALAASAWRGWRGRRGGHRVRTGGRQQCP